MDCPLAINCKCFNRGGFMSQLDRRSFFKFSALAVGAVAFLRKSPGLIAEAYAEARKDAGITKLNYHGNITAKAPSVGSAKKFYDKHVKKVVKFFSKPKNKETFKIADADQIPYCKYCKLYTKVDENWGWCTQVAKKNNKKGQMASANGWCQMFNLHSKGKLKKVLGA